MKAKCQNPKCLYEWDFKSKLMKVSCPSCGSKVEIRDKRRLKNNESKKDNR